MSYFVLKRAQIYSIPRQQVAYSPEAKNTPSLNASSEIMFHTLALVIIDLNLQKKRKFTFFIGNVVFSSGKSNFPENRQH